MIDLSHNRAALLAEIEAPNPTDHPLGDITDFRVATTDTHVRVCGHAPEDLFPFLKLALSERFAGVPRLQLIRDLLMPLKHALGNAARHGNGRDPAKLIVVEVVLTRRGALIAVTDEGEGFDAVLTFRRFQEQQSYFVNRGIGFRHLHQARCTASYENGGRTVLLCYQPTMSASEQPGAPALSAHEPAPHPPLGPPFPHRGRETGEGAAQTRRVPFESGGSLPKILDSGWIQNCLSTEVAAFSDGLATIESCRVYATRGHAADDCGHRYVLRVPGLDGRPTETRILTGRLHASAATAEADFEAATKLRDAATSASVRIPRPVARLRAEPRLVLYDFDPWMPLWEYLTYECEPATVRHCAEKIGRALARLHRNPVQFRRSKPEFSGEGFGAMIARAQRNLQTLACEPDLVQRFRNLARRIWDPAAVGQEPTPAPIHGAFGWDCIYYGVDNYFYLFRFESCRRGAPGLDLGGFAADLLRFTLAHRDEESYSTCREAFLSEYNRKATRPMGEDHLRFYTALAVAERLGRTQNPARADTEQLRRAMEAALCGWGSRCEVAP